MRSRRRGRLARPLLYFCVLALGASLGAPPVSAQSFPGWQVRRTPHYLLYTVEGTPGARDIEQISADLELIYADAVAPLGLPPVRLVYPLYPSLERFRADWWHFATMGYGEVVHAWGTIYTGDDQALTPYTVTRAVIGDIFPRAIPLLRWGLGDALGDRVAGVDAHAHMRAVVSGPPPSVRDILDPSGFSDHLPLSYPISVSFVAFLLERYGLRKTADFVDRVGYRYFDFADLFAAQFGEPLGDVERAWQARVAAAVRPRSVDVGAYLEAARFVYRVTLAGNPGRRMLLPDGPVVVSEAFAAADSLRRLDLAAIRPGMERARAATERAERSEQRTEHGLRGIVYVVVLTPILFAIAWLLWPTIRGRLAAGKGAVRHG